jgi:hypothetical protein
LLPGGGSAAAAADRSAATAPSPAPAAAAPPQAPRGTPAGAQRRGAARRDSLGGAADVEAEFDRQQGVQLLRQARANAHSKLGDVLTLLRDACPAAGHAPRRAADPDSAAPREFSVQPRPLGVGVGAVPLSSSKLVALMGPTADDTALEDITSWC